MSSDIGDLLNRPHIKPMASNANVDPAVKTRISVNLDQVTVYDKNPRRGENPAYQLIKDSIKARGLDQDLSVTRRSPGDKYMMRSGGNTRLEVLRELYAETNDPQFYSFECNFYPWTSDLDNIIGSLCENDARGDMLFIARAMSVQDIVAELQKEGLGDLSIRQLATEISGRGWRVSTTSLSTMIYAIDNLFEVIPLAFWGGMGRDSVQKTRKFLTRCQEFWESVAEEHEGKFDDIWQPAFTSVDEENFSLAEAQRATENAIATALRSPLSNVQGEIQALMEGIIDKAERPSSVFDAVPQAPVDPIREPIPARPIAPEPRQENATAPETNSHVKPDTQESPALKESNNSNRVQEGGQPIERPLEAGRQIASKPVYDTDVAGLHPLERNFVLAQKIADVAGIEHMILHPSKVPDSDKAGHNGFFISKPVGNEIEHICNSVGNTCLYHYLFEMAATSQHMLDNLEGEVIVANSGQPPTTHPVIDLQWFYQWKTPMDYAYRAMGSQLFRTQFIAKNTQGIDDYGALLGRLMPQLEISIGEGLV